MTAAARLIALDWGTTSLRAFLMGDDGIVLEERAKPWGIMATPDGNFGQALHQVTDDWQQRFPSLPMIAAGMIGSAQGWREIPYLSCPAGLDELVAGITRQVADRTGRLPIVPGIAMDGAIPDVMRGEETQIIGAIARDPALAANALLILPGTHSKWVTVREGRVMDFTTYLTGEMFAVLGQYSILGRPARDARPHPADPPGADAWAAFDQGVQAISDNPDRSLSSLLFSTRTLVLTHRLAAEVSLDYLSGLLLGEELRSARAVASIRAGAPLALIGDPGLCARYRRALGHFDITDAPVIDAAAAAGLWQIARHSLLQTAR